MSTFSPTPRVPSPPNQAAAEIEAYIRQHGGQFRLWYAGIAADPCARLFVDHNVNEHTGDLWIHRNAGSEAAARAAERYLLGLGCKGDDGGGDNRTQFVYAYLITSRTRE